MSKPRLLTRWWFNQPLRRKGLLVLALPLLALVVAVVIRLPYTQQQQETTALFSHAEETRAVAQQLVITLLDLDSGVHGLARNREPQYAAGVDTARRVIPPLVQALDRLLTSSDEHQLFLRVTSLVDQQLAKAASAVSLIESGGSDRDRAVQDLLAEGRTTMKGTRETLNQLLRNQYLLANASAQTLNEMNQLLRPFVMATLIGGLFGALVAAWLYGTGISTRISALERNAERLARGDRLRRTAARGDDEIGSLDLALRRASLLLRTRERELRDLNAELERTVHEQVLLNRELEAFSYSVSHDLRAPLRSIDGFAQALREDWGERMDAAGQDHLARVRNAAQRMGRLIDDLLKLSTVSRSPLQRSDVDISQVARDVIGDLTTRNPTRVVQWVVTDDMHVWCDPSLARIILENLLGNAYKFTSKTPSPRIEFTSLPNSHPTVYVIRDNGAGFDMKYVQKLFAPFQRLHADREFPGSGIGLATVQRIVHKHGGEVRTDAEVNRGATFRFTLEPSKPAAAA